MLDGFVFKVQGKHLAQIGAVGAGHEVEWPHEEVGVFGVREVGQEHEHQTHSHPPAKVPAKVKRCGITANHKCLGNEIGDGLEGIGSVLGDVKGGAHHAKADVEQDEQGDGKGIPVNAPFADFGQYFDVVPNFEYLIAPGKAAQNEVKHTNEDKRAKNVGGQAVNIANDVVG